MEREKRFELSTPSLARRCSTTELFPRVAQPYYHGLPVRREAVARKVRLLLGFGQAHDIVSVDCGRAGCEGLALSELGAEDLRSEEPGGLGDVEAREARWLAEVAGEAAADAV